MEIMLRWIHVATDPGVKGATVCQWVDGRHTIYPWKGEASFAETVEEIKNLADVDWENRPSNAVRLHWAMEVPPKTTGKGRPESSGFTLGHNYGWQCGFITGSGLPCMVVSPQKWQSLYYGLKGTPYREKKKRCRELAKRLYPTEKVTLQNADAFLILNYSIKS
jgi:hypothetical protein